MSYLIEMNGVPTGVTYKELADARHAVHELFGDCELTQEGAMIMYWPSVSTKGNARIEIKQITA
jgi:hypothetical protein